MSRLKKRNKAKKNVFVKKMFFVFLFTFFLAVVALLYYFVPRLITITSIKCTNQWGSCPNEITDNLNTFIPGKYNTVKKSIEDRLNSDSQIEKYQLLYEFPSTINLSLVSKKAVLAVYVNNRYYLLSDSLNVLGEVNSTDLPFLVVDEVVEEGKLNVKDYSFGFQLINGMSKNYTQSIKATNSGYEAEFDNYMVLLPKEGDEKYLLGALEIVIQKLNKSDQQSRIGKEGKTVIDLRFGNPIIKYQ